MSKSEGGKGIQPQISPNIAELRIKTKTIRKKNLKTKNKNLKI